jgi:hypothetical protein
MIAARTVSPFEPAIVIKRMAPAERPDLRSLPTPRVELRPSRLLPPTGETATYCPFWARRARPEPHRTTRQPAVEPSADPAICVSKTTGTYVPIWRAWRLSSADVLCARSVRGGQAQIGIYGAAILWIRVRAARLVRRRLSGAGPRNVRRPGNGVIRRAHFRSPNCRVASQVCRTTDQPVTQRRSHHRTRLWLYPKAQARHAPRDIA